MAKYSYAQLKALWIQAGGNKLMADIAAAVAMAESGGDSQASNTNTDGSIDRGLWQINSVHGQLSTFDPVANAKAAVKVSGNGQNWSPWVTFNSGAYKKYLSPTTAADSTMPPSDATTTSLIPGISVSGLVESAINQLLKMLGLGSLKDLAERAGLIILGFALIILGIHLLASGSGSKTAVTVNEPKQEGGTRTKSSKAVSEGTAATKKVGATEALEAAAVA